MKQASSILFAFLASAGALAGTLLLQASAPAAPRGADPASFRPNPRDFVRIIEGDVYVVPAGKVLTIATLTSINGNMGMLILEIDGRPALGGRVDNGPQEFALGVTARPGQAVAVSEVYPDPLMTAEALGYLTEL